jgi:hypothetical protein
MDYSWEINKNGLKRTVRVKSHPYDLIEFSVLQKLEDEGGKSITDSGYTTFYSSADFRELFEPVVNKLKERFENDIPDSI